MSENIFISFFLSLLFREKKKWEKKNKEKIFWRQKLFAEKKIKRKSILLRSLWEFILTTFTVFKKLISFKKKLVKNISQ